ncbi:MAG: hypothetical protein EA425_07465 [Puniceicoccaceae bacterium]|nr:MAG: hypothetical protein EA425_07465 [Puniceicoccaceae bacterium]
MLARLRQLRPRLYPLLGVGLGGWFFVLALGFYSTEVGFTRLIEFGHYFHERALPQMQEIRHHVVVGTPGYDGQFYAQIALHPLLQEDDLVRAADNLPYRARRIASSWAAWLLGFGQPVFIIQAYAILNLLCWYAAALLLLHWIPLTSAFNFLRWSGCLLCAGTAMSIRQSLADLPAMVLILAGVLLLERGRPWLSAGVLALSGLTKETSVLAAAGRAEPLPFSIPSWLRQIAYAALVALPMLLWMVWLGSRFGFDSMGGARNFALPGVELGAKITDTARTLIDRGRPWPGFWTLLALLAQIAWLLVRFVPRLPWWRIGAVFAVLALFLGEAVFEGYIGAYARAVLPLTFAFNLLLVPTRLGWAFLILGNLSILAFLPSLRVHEPWPAHRLYEERGAIPIRSVESQRERETRAFLRWMQPPPPVAPHAAADWGERWEPASEGSRWGQRRPQPGAAWIVRIEGDPLLLGLHVTVVPEVTGSMPARLETGPPPGRVLWSGELPASAERWKLPPFELPPGKNELRLVPADPAHNLGAFKFDDPTFILHPSGADPP